MAEKTFDELLSGAQTIRDNELPESNTHALVGEQLVNMVEKSKEESGKKLAISDLASGRGESTTTAMTQAAVTQELVAQDEKLAELSSAIGGTFNVSLPSQKTGKYYSGSVGSTFTEIENEDSIYFDYIDISSANRITININSSVTSTSRKILAVDTDNRIVSSKSEGDVKETGIKEIVFDSVELQNSSKLLISIHKTSSINFISVEGTGIKGEVANNKQEISKINDSLSDIDRKVDNIEGKIVGGETDIDLGDELTDYSYFGSSGEEVETTITKSSICYNPIVLSNSGKIVIRLSGYGATSSRSIGIASSAGIWKEVVLEKNPTRMPRPEISCMYLMQKRLHLFLQNKMQLHLLMRLNHLLIH